MFFRFIKLVFQLYIALQFISYKTNMILEITGRVHYLRVRIGDRTTTWNDPRLTRLIKIVSLCLTLERLNYVKI